MQTPTAEEETYSVTPAGLAALEGFAPDMTKGTQAALEAPGTAPAHGNEALENEALENEALENEALENEAFQPEGTTEAAPFVPDTAEKVDWVLGRIADHRARAARIRENAELMAKDADRQAEGLEWQFGPALQAFARQELTGKKKSLRLFHGVIGYRTKPAGVTVGNEAEAIVWAKQNLPLAVVERLDKKALAEALLSTGEAVDFAAFTVAEEVFYIK